MPTFRVRIDATKYVAGVHELQRSQLPYAMARTLTMCAKDGQQAARQQEFARFKLRNNWTVARTLYRPAEKKSQRQEAMVFTDTQNRRTGAPDYMGRQESGGTKLPYGGLQWVAVPTKYLRQMCPGVIPTELKPLSLIGAVGGRFTSYHRTTGGIVLRNQRQVNGFVFFVQDISDGHKAIMGRYFTDRQAYPFYLLIPEAHISPRADMEAAVQRAVEEQFPIRWEQTWRDIMVKGLRIRA